MNAVRMRKKSKYLLLTAAVCLCLCTAVESSKEVLKDFSKHFRKVVDECKRELDLSDVVYYDFDHFWDEGFELKNKDTGCAVMCVSFKIEMVDTDLILQHGNAFDFITKKGGADETLARELVAILHECGQNLPHPEDECLSVLAWAVCFKAEIHNRGMNPPTDILLAEILAEAEAAAA